MARWTGTWLSGVGAAGTARTGPGGQDRWRGDRLGLPPSGVGSLASTGGRLLAFLLDLAAGAAIGGLVNRLLSDPDPGQRTLVVNAAFALQVLVLTALTGQSLGMRVFGIGVERLADRGVPGFLPAAIRTALLLLLVPAMISDRDGRGLHDRAAGTAVLRRRASRREPRADEAAGRQA